MSVNRTCVSKLNAISLGVRPCVGRRALESPRALKIRWRPLSIDVGIKPAKCFYLIVLYRFDSSGSFDRSAAERQTRDGMLQVKDTLRATVQVSFDGRVYKTYHGPDAQQRFDREVRVLRYLEARGCGFVPRLLEADPAKLRIVASNCGTRVEHLDADRAKELFAELESFGVRHDDPDVRNVTYRQSDGRFCVVDFELATILPGFE